VHLAPAVVGISVVEFVPVVVLGKQPQLVVEPTVPGRQLDVRLLRRRLVEKLELELPIVLGKQLLVQPDKQLVVRQLVRLQPELVWLLVVRQLVPLVAPAVELDIVVALDTAMAAGAAGGLAASFSSKSLNADGA